ncbi:hypothetical protein ACSBR1_034194 [Camellia fascicularis]
MLKSIPASGLLRKLRWSTLGLQFDWSKRNYNVSLPHNKIPDALCQLAKKMAAPAMPSGEEFRPEAAIVNYFELGDTLGGHLDDMEADWTKPIVSISLGCKAVFLLGGKSRQDPLLLKQLVTMEVIQWMTLWNTFKDEFENEKNMLGGSLEHPCCLKVLLKDYLSETCRAALSHCSGDFQKQSSARLMLQNHIYSFLF